ncbi:TfoX/Sxy family protein [Nocardioides sambongensis]|uniref:TfoX/Sxy family protein n=1 Tax=Nocardioides sambongensis TaxID=2589074 RepID=UPI00112E07A3|nr:TfoX/Sxy family protein [Nocardioides sambongensis]
MAYDETLATRVRAALDGLPIAGGRLGAEKAMFGGLAFLLDGSMALAVSGQGGIMVRVGAGAARELVASTPAEPVEMGTRVMGGWVRVAAEHLTHDDELSAWVARGVAALD